MKNSIKNCEACMNKFDEKGYLFPFKIFYENGFLGLISNVEVKAIFNKIKDNNIESPILERLKMLVDGGLDFEVTSRTEITPGYWKGILWDITPTGSLEDYKQEEALFEVAIACFEEVIRKDISEITSQFVA